MAEGRVAHNRYIVSFAPRNHTVLDGPFLQMIEDLVASEPVVSGNFPCLFEVGNVEIADAPRQNFPILSEALESFDRILERITSTPMQQITIQPIGAQSTKRPITCGDRTGTRRILRQHLRYQKHFVAPALNCLTDEFFGVAIHFSRVDVRHSEFDPQTQGSDSCRSIGVVDLPGTLADNRELLSSIAKAAKFHVRSTEFSFRAHIYFDAFSQPISLCVNLETNLRQVFVSQHGLDSQFAPSQVGFRINQRPELRLHESFLEVSSWQKR